MTRQASGLLLFCGRGLSVGDRSVAVASTSKVEVNVDHQRNSRGGRENYMGKQSMENWVCMTRGRSHRGANRIKVRESLTAAPPPSRPLCSLQFVQCKSNGL